MGMLNKGLLKVVFAAGVVGALMMGCQSSSPKAEGFKAGALTEEEIGLRKSDLYSEKTDITSGIEYIHSPAGESTLIPRSFENAPPMIPHTVEGMIPIKGDYNACVGCHMPDVAKGVKATAVPKSHLTNFRPDHKLDTKGDFVPATDNSKSEVVVRDLKGELYHGRFNCTQCHAPQTRRAPAVENEFRPYFRSESDAKASNLLDIMNEGVK